MRRIFPPLSSVEEAPDVKAILLAAGSARRLQAGVIWVADQPRPALVKAVPELEKRWGEADLWVIPADAVIDPALLREMADRPTNRPVAAIGEWPTASTRKGTGVLRVNGRWLRGLLSASGDRELSAVLADVASGSDVEEISNHARLCLPSLAQADGRRVERLLFAGLQSSSDGWVDRYLNRKVSAVWTRWLLQTRLSPNDVTRISLAIGLLAALSFSQVGWVSGVVGALLLGALVGRLEWFLWGLAVGVNVFWPTALGLAWKARRVAHG